MERFEYVLIDIDTQNDFVDPRGSLYMAGAAAIVPNLERLFRWARENAVPVLSTVDAHVPDDPEFREFPPHCVVGTWGHEKVRATTTERMRRTNPEEPYDAIGIEALLAEGRQVVFEKRTYGVFDNPNVERALASLPAEAFVVCGVATDYCVRAVVDKLLALGRRVILVTDAIAAVDPAAEKGIIDNFDRRGVRLVRTDRITATTTKV